MTDSLTRSSRLLTLSGVAAVLFGIAVLVWPNIGLAALLALFGAFSLIAGVFEVVYGLEMASQHVRHWVPMVLAGVASIAIGVFAFLKPSMTALALVYVIAAFAILTGMFEFVAGIELNGEVKNAWTLSLAGLASVAFGVIAALRPGSGALAIVWLIGIWAIVAGILQIVAAYQLGHESSEIKKAAPRMGTA